MFSLLSVQITLFSYLFKYCYCHIGHVVTRKRTICAGSHVKFMVSDISPVFAKSRSQRSLCFTNILVVFAVLFCTFNKIHYVLCNACNYNTLHYTTLHYTTLHYAEIHYNTTHYNTLQYNTLQYIYITALHYSTKT